MMNKSLHAVLSLRDTTFTLDDMHNQACRQPATLIRARALNGFDQLISTLGGDPATLLQTSGLSLRDLENPEACIELEKVVRLLDSSAHTLGIADLGLRLGQRKDISVLGTIALIARYSATLGEALAGVGRHLPYHTPDASLLVSNDPLRPGYTCIRYQLDLDEDWPRRQAIELSYSIMRGFLQLLTSDSGADWHMQFRHAPGCSAESYRSHLGEHIAFDQREDALSIPTHLLDVPIDAGDSRVREAAERFLRNLQRRFPLDITRQVETLVERQLATGGSSLQRVAEQLGLHPRTLQRRLAEQGNFFEDIVDRLRQQRAQILLQDSALPLAEIASVLGYTEQSSLNRSCSRWFGMSPNSYRKRALN